MSTDTNTSWGLTKLRLPACRAIIGLSFFVYTVMLAPFVYGQDHYHCVDPELTLDLIKTIDPTRRSWSEVNNGDCFR